MISCAQCHLVMPSIYAVDDHGKEGAGEMIGKRPSQLGRLSCECRHVGGGHRRRRWQRGHRGA
eukprot:4498449-Prymnesium_polylepis.1